MKKYFVIGSFLLLLPFVSFASIGDTLNILAKANVIANSAGSSLSANPDLQASLNSVYENIIELLRQELASLLPPTASVTFNTISTPITQGALQTFSFSRTPAESMSPLSLSVQNDKGRIVGILADKVTGGSVTWQAADNFINPRSYTVVAMNAAGQVLGRSNSFMVSSSTPNISPNITSMSPASAATPVSLPQMDQNAVGSSDINFGSIGFWSFDRGSNDCVTKGGAMVNDDGRIGSGLDLNGTDAYCQVANNRAFYPKSFTLALWAKSAPTFSSGWNDSNWFVSLRDQSGYNIGPVKGSKSVQFMILDDTNMNQNSYLVGTATPDSITDWHHYAMTYDGAVANVYLDGALISSTSTIISRSNAGNNNLNFGLDDVLGQPHGAGSLDEIRLYNRAMTPCEIRFLAGKGCAGISSAFDPFANTASLLNSGK